MKPYGLSFHHLGLAAAKREKALKFIEGLGYAIGEEVFDPQQKVNVRLCTSESMPSVEIITPSGEKGPLNSLLKERSEVIYHVCFSTRDLEQSLKAMKEDGIRVLCLSPAKKAPLFNGMPVSFYRVDGFGLIEILDERG